MEGGVVGCGCECTSLSPLLTRLWGCRGFRRSFVRELGMGCWLRRRILLVLRAAVVVVGVCVIVVGGVGLRCTGRLKGRGRGSRAARGG